MSASFALTSVLLLSILAFQCHVKRQNTGTMRKMMMASGQHIVQRMMNEPMSVMRLVISISGPWWLSSVMAKRSFVIRLMSTPVRFLSKNEKESV